MRVPKKAWWMALAVAAVVAVVLFILNPSQRLEYTLPDGSVLRVEKVSFWKQQQDAKVGGWKRTVRDWFMFKLARRFPGRFKFSSIVTPTWWMGPRNTNTDVLQVWLTRRDPATGKYLRIGDMQTTTAQLVDEHGCTFLETRLGYQLDRLLGNDDNVGWFAFEAFPRHESNFRLQLSGYPGKAEPEFTIRNPAPAPRRMNWAAEPLPITKRDGDVAFTLTGIKIETNSDRLSFPYVFANSSYRIAPSFDVRERGQLTKEWQADYMELSDGSGNFTSSQFKSESVHLCPWESVWKLRVRFFGGEQSVSASNSVWTIPGIKVPGDGEFVALNATNRLQGVSIKALALAGAGNVNYSNGAVVRASPFVDGKRANSWSLPLVVSDTAIDAGSITPVVVLQIGGLSENRRLTVRATDDQGRQIYAERAIYPDGLRMNPAETINQKGIHYFGRNETTHFLYRLLGSNFLMLDLPKDAKTVDLTFCIHSGRTEEFVFKPPMPEKR